GKLLRQQRRVGQQQRCGGYKLVGGRRVLDGRVRGSLGREFQRRIIRGHQQRCGGVVSGGRHVVFGGRQLCRGKQQRECAGGDGGDGNRAAWRRDAAGERAGDERESAGT